MAKTKEGIKANIRELESIVDAMLIGKVFASFSTGKGEEWEVKDRIYLIHKTGVVKCYDSISMEDMKQGKLPKESTIPDKYFSEEEFISDLRNAYEFSVKISYVLAPEREEQIGNVMLFADSDEEMLNLIHYKDVVAKEQSTKENKVEILIEDPLVKEAYELMLPIMEEESEKRRSLV